MLRPSIMQVEAKTKEIDTETHLKALSEREMVRRCLWNLKVLIALTLTGGWLCNQVRAQPISHAASCHGLHPCTHRIQPSMGLAKGATDAGV